MELYHWEPNGASARVLIALHEKRLAFHSHYVDVPAFEQHAPAFLALNPSGEVPVLVDRGTALHESSYICEYLEEAYPAVALMPGDAHGRWQVRVWQKAVDDHVAASVSELAWQALELPKLQRRERGALAAAVARIPSPERRAAWAAAVAGYGAEVLERARARLADTLGRMEQALQAAEWLVGGALSLADIALYAYLDYLPRVAPQLLHTDVAPAVRQWLARMHRRPAVQAALALGRQRDPFAVAAPGPEQVRWG
jgi:GST-like protein